MNLPRNLTAYTAGEIQLLNSARASLDGGPKWGTWQDPRPLDSGVNLPLRVYVINGEALFAGSAMSGGGRYHQRSEMFTLGELLNGGAESGRPVPVSSWGAVTHRGYLKPDGSSIFPAQADASAYCDILLDL